MQMVSIYQNVEFTFKTYSAYQPARKKLMTRLSSCFATQMNGEIAAWLGSGRCDLQKKSSPA